MNKQWRFVGGSLVGGIQIRWLAVEVHGARVLEEGRVKDLSFR